MTRSAADIVEFALRKIGVFSTYDTGADASQYAVALDAFDMLMAEIVGTELLWWFVPASQTIPLTIDEDEYSLNSYTENDLQFIHSVWITESTGTKERPLVLLRKEQYDLYKTELTGSGRIDYCYVERNDTPKLKVLKAPQQAGMSLRVEGQRYSDNMISDNGEVAHDFPKAWERYLYHLLALDIGSGLITTLPENELTRIEKAATLAKRRLDARNKLENIKKPRATKAYGL